jgi:hypothetical protein
MEKYLIESDLTVFGVQVKTFPLGIGEAFDQLIQLLPGGFDRSFYGISFLSKAGTMVYIAAATENLTVRQKNTDAKNTLLKKERT